MTPDWRRDCGPAARVPRLAGRALAGLVAILAQAPIAAAHDTTATGGLVREHGVLLAALGVALVGGAVALKRTGRVSPTAALHGVFVGVVVAALGAVLFEGLSPDPTYAASAMPFPRSWYRPLSLLVGVTVAAASFLVGWLRWPTRPRYTFLGLLFGVWVAYPHLVPGTTSDTHPLGYVVVLGTPLLLGYVVWRDAGSVLRGVLRDPVARRFGVGIGAVLALFFVAASGYLSFLPDEGFPHEPVVAVLPVTYQLVTWPTVEVALPHVPLFLALSPGLLVVVGTLSVLVGLNAALVARHWRVEERAGGAEGAAGSAALVGACTCGCCGPLVAKVALLVAGPAIAAPLYWVFVDSASPLGPVFVVGSLLLFTGTLVRSVASARRSGRTSEVVPAD